MSAQVAGVHRFGFDQFLPRLVQLPQLPLGRAPVQGAEPFAQGRRHAGGGDHLDALDHAPPSGALPATLQPQHRHREQAVDRALRLLAVDADQRPLRLAPLQQPTHVGRAEGVLQVRRGEGIGHPQLRHGAREHAPQQADIPLP